MSESEFGEKFYSDLWGTVHRHDYCPHLAQALVAHYGKCRILDIGTGCGYLVQFLRALGCDAWGLDASTFAVRNTCAPGFVLEGSMTEIPFKDNRFDVVHSQGLWEYIAESDIARAYAECLRVGAHQCHTIDYLGSETGESGFVTAQTREWWEEKLQPPRILVACPVHEKKEYAFQKWIENVKAFTYPHKEFLVVDTTESAGFMHRYSGQIRIVNIGGGWGWQHVARAMDRIREHFLSGNFRYWFNVESDILPPRDAIERMLEFGEGADWISHCFPRRLGNHAVDFDQGIGCSILSPRLVSDFTWGQTIDTPDCRLWEQVRPKNKYKVLEMWGLFPVVHLKEP